MKAGLQIEADRAMPKTALIRRKPLMRYDN
jgi:hypothetical protein